jgi:uncharacterized protein YprB with RNaseH-like and TPR domain
MKVNHSTKVLIFDLETYGFDFSADKGYILCASYKWLDENKVHTIAHTDMAKFRSTPQDDKEICRQLLAVIVQADVLVGWNSKSFDARFLQTRLMKHGLGYLPPVPHCDLLLTSRQHTKMRRSLDNTQKFFGLSEAKTPLNIDTWMAAGRGEAKALKEVITHCVQDVKVTEEAYKLFAPLSQVHPNVSFKDGKAGCPLCGAEKLQQRGTIWALRHFRIRYHCQDCGRWSTSHPYRTKQEKGNGK